MPKFKLFVDGGFVGCVHEAEAEIDDETWSGLSQEDKDKWLEEQVEQHVWNSIDAYAEEIKDEEDDDESLENRRALP